MRRFLFCLSLSLLVAYPSVLYARVGTFLNANQAASDDTTSYGSAVIEPGDIINFRGGMFTTGNILTYGHTALYLGRGAAGIRLFLDFSVTKDSDDKYKGRILTEPTFLTYNRDNHDSFDVFRLRDRSTLNKKTLLAAAEWIARDGWWGPPPYGEFCSTAVAKVLSEATRTRIDAANPDVFVSSPLFQRHPGLIGKSISIRMALNSIVSRDAEEESVRTKAFEKTLRDFQWEQLRVWTSFACLYMHPPTSLSAEQQYLQGKTDKIYRQALLDNLVVMPAIELAERRIGDRKLSACQREVIDWMINAEGPLDVAWLVERMDYERAGGKTGEVLRRVGGTVGSAIKRGTAVVVRGVSVPFVVANGILTKIDWSAGGNERSTSSVERTEQSTSSTVHDSKSTDTTGSANNAPPRGASIPTLQGEAWRQLRGIASGSLKFQ